MKIVDKGASLVGKPLESPAQEVRDGYKGSSGQQVSLAREDRVTLSGGGEVNQTVSEMLDERRRKLDQIQSLLRAGGPQGYFQARPELASGVTQGISSEVALIQEMIGKKR